MTAPGSSVCTTSEASNAGSCASAAARLRQKPTPTRKMDFIISRNPCLKSGRKSTCALNGEWQGELIHFFKLMGQRQFRPNGTTKMPVGAEARCNAQG